MSECVCLSECDYCPSAEDNKFPELLYEIALLPTLSLSFLLPTLRIHCLCKKQTNFWDTIVGLTFYLQAKYALIMKINDYIENKQLTKQPNQRIKQINNYTMAILLLVYYSYYSTIVTFDIVEYPILIIGHLIYQVQFK